MGGWLKEINEHTATMINYLISVSSEVTKEKNYGIFFFFHRTTALTCNTVTSSNFKFFVSTLLKSFLVLSDFKK